MSLSKLLGDVNLSKQFTLHCGKVLLFNVKLGTTQDSYAIGILPLWTFLWKTCESLVI